MTAISRNSPGGFRTTLRCCVCFAHERCDRRRVFSLCENRQSVKSLRTSSGNPLWKYARKCIGRNSTEQRDLDKDARRSVAHRRIRFLQAASICELEWKEID